MSEEKDKAAENPQVLNLTKMPDQKEAQAKAWMAVNPETNAALVIDAFQANMAGSDVELVALIEALRKSTDQSKAGDLSTLEAMLIGQATALQAIFTNFARRAVNQQDQKNLETLHGPGHEGASPEPGHPIGAGRL
jgi:hypothetical protein